MDMHSCNKIFAIDIETIPNLNLIDSLPDIDVKIGNLSDPLKIANKKDEAKKLQIKNMALSPFTGRICSCAIYGDGISDAMPLPYISDAYELAVIEFALSYLNNSSWIISWNGKEFDIPFIYTRAMLLRSDTMGCMPKSYWTNRYTTYPHCDLMLEFNGYKPYGEGFSLDWISGNTIGERKNPRDYSNYINLIECGKSYEIGIDNLTDARLTFLNFKLCEKYFF